jgi:hypothetical protein
MEEVQVGSKIVTWMSDTTLWQTELGKVTCELNTVWLMRWQQILHKASTGYFVLEVLQLDSQLEWRSCDQIHEKRREWSS